jgi:uncharacterized damage-inducible protein DinB
MSTQSPRTTLALAALLLAVAAAPALAHGEAEHTTLHADLIANIDGAGQKLIALAEAIPADKYGWAPNDEVRTVSEVFMHVVGVNMLLPSALGAALPEGLTPETANFGTMQQWEKDVTTKDAVIAKLRASFEYVSSAINQVQDLDAEVSLFGPPQSKRAYLFIILAHAHEHLGQAIAYTRTMGIVPPWSRPAPSSEGDAGDAGHDHGDSGHGAADHAGHDHGDGGR